MGIQAAANFLAGCILVGFGASVVSIIIAVANHILQSWKPKVKIDVPISITTNIL
jgi:hypothetical protein